MTIPVYQIDAFADRAFSGNPAAVCLLDTPGDEQWMQAVAAEMNLSETAFLEPCDGAWGLRWFTPVAEVRLCGHGTLASAHVLWHEVGVDAEELFFSTLSGTLAARRCGEVIELDFPARETTPIDAPPGLLEALGVEADFVGRNVDDVLVVVRDERTVRDLEPDFATLAGCRARGIVVTARSEDGAHDFVSRFFAPAIGINEDPVTGSAHCCLAPFWSERLGREELLGYQASNRGGFVEVEVQGDRVALRGRAVTVSRGQLLV